MSIRTMTLLARATTEVGLSRCPPIDEIGDSIELNRSADLDVQNMEVSFTFSISAESVTRSGGLVKKIKSSRECAMRSAP
jgi:hypothetical protein